MQYKIHCDGGARGNPGPAASAFVVIDEKGRSIFAKGFYLGIATNNEAEYQAVYCAMLWLSKNLPDATLVTFVLDSQLVVNQLKGVYKIKEKRLLEWAVKIKALEKLSTIKITYVNVPRSENKIADTLVNSTLDKESHSEK
jgi:ribonuclease HI